MYAVIRYFNYRKEVSFTILKTFKNFENADNYALECAKKDFGDQMVEGVSERWVYVDSEIEVYTKGDGYDQFVYTVMSLPELEDESDTVSENENYLNCPLPTPSTSDNEESDNESDNEESDNESVYEENEYGERLKIEKHNGKYEWGFDLTDFNDENKSNGASKFKNLLDSFDMKFIDDNNNGSKWSNKDDSLILITGNNPITGEYLRKDMRQQSEKGYLSYVGVSCTSIETLQRFLSEFKSKASFIKGESNNREYI